MFGIGETELLIIVVFAFMIFGPDKLPGMGRTIGRALRQFREAQEDFTQVVQAEVVDPLNDALNEPSARKRAKEAARAAATEDADLDEAPTSPRRQETFAERRARLQAERVAREGTAQGEGEAAVPAPDAGDSDLDAPVAEPASIPVAEAPTAGAAATSAAALYALSSRHEPALPTAADASAAPDGPVREGEGPVGGEEVVDAG